MSFEVLSPSTNEYWRKGIQLVSCKHIVIGQNRILSASLFNIDNNYISLITSIQLTKFEMAKLEFLESIRSLPTTNRSELFSSDDIVEKMNFMSGPKPTEHSSSLRWQRLH